MVMEMAVKAHLLAYLMFLWMTDIIYALYLLLLQILIHICKTNGIKTQGLYYNTRGQGNRDEQALVGRVIIFHLNQTPFCRTIWHTY